MIFFLQNLNGLNNIILYINFLHFINPKKTLIFIIIFAHIHSCCQTSEPKLAKKNFVETPGYHPGGLLRAKC